MSSRRPPLVVVEDPAELASVVDGLQREGWYVKEGWEQVAGAAVLTGAVSDAGDVEAALLAAARGAGIAASVQLEQELLERFFEDLRHLGTVEYRPRRATGEGVHPRQALTSDQLDLLALLADGMSLKGAAAELHISRRTADRRLAAARATLGVRTRAEAVLLAQRKR